MASTFNLKITTLRIYSIFLILLVHKILAHNYDTTRQLKVNEFRLVGDLRDLIEFYKKELDWERRDSIDGLIHWGINDFASDLLVKMHQVQPFKPQCVVITDSVRHQIINNSFLINDCLQNLHKKLDAAKELADRLSNVSQLDNLVSQLVEYKKNKDVEVTKCYKPNYDDAFRKHKNEMDRIEMCLQVNNYS